MPNKCPKAPKNSGKMRIGIVGARIPYPQNKLPKKYPKVLKRGTSWGYGIPSPPIIPPLIFPRVLTREMPEKAQKTPQKCPKVPKRGIFWETAFHHHQLFQFSFSGYFWALLGIFCRAPRKCPKPIKKRPKNAFWEGPRTTLPST